MEDVSEDRRLERVLVGIDGSARGEEAARQGARIASLVGASLELVAVMEPDHAGSDPGSEAEGWLARSAAAVRDLGAAPDERVLGGDPAEELVAHAREREADLICLGPDAGLLGHAIRVGRVAKHVLREAPCSVMLARPSAQGFPSSVTCGVDGSDASIRTATLAGELAAGAGARLHLLHVVPVFRGRDAEWTLEQDEESPPELGPAVDAVTALGVTPVREMAMGRPEHALVAAAERDGSDLLVVGHRGVRGVSRVLLGSVSEYCAEHARCSVLVARGSNA